MKLGIPVYEGVNLLDVAGPMRCVLCRSRLGGLGSARGIDMSATPVYT
jgi:hypothetical protein